MNAERKLKKNLDHIQRDIGSLIEQFDETGSDVQSTVKNFGGQSIEQVRNAIENLNKTVGSVSQSVEQANQKVRQQIKRNPYASIACAVGVGALAGFLAELTWKKGQS